MSSKLDLTSVVKKQIEALEIGVDLKESGIVLSVGDGVCRVYGLDGAFSGEMVEFENGVKGLCLNIEEDNIGVIILGVEAGIESGQEVKRLKVPMEVQVGKELLGRVVDGLGNPIDGKGEIKTSLKAPVEVKAPGIIDRKSVHEPFQTGIKAIDCLIPIGRGQRELLIGDRQTGKTAIIMDSILNQKLINDNARSESEKIYCI